MLLYCRYVIPEYLANYSDMTRYYITVVFMFIVIQSQANWLCVYFYSSAHRPSRDNPQEEVLTPLSLSVEETSQKETHQPQSDDMEQKLKTSENGKVIVMEDIHSNKTGLTWGYCDKCKLPKPPRSHHCKVCDVCILKRDHHCYFANTCIGFYNQRYFVIFAFYMGLGCFIGLFLEGFYLMWKLSESSYWDFFLPVTLYKSVTGEHPVYFVYIVGHLYSFLPVGFMSIGFFVTQMAAISVGKTTHEISTRVRIKPLRDSAHNFRSVFGGFWAANFILPAVIIFRQEGNGKHWNDVKKY